MGGGEERTGGMERWKERCEKNGEWYGETEGDKRG